MSLTSEQRKVIRRSLRTADRFGASPRERKALLEALKVESNFRDLPYGDRDSVGALQQRPSQGWGPAGEPLETDVTQFLRAARKSRGVHGSAGVLAQAVQRSAFPGRYDQNAGLAEALLHGNVGGGGQQTPMGGSPAAGQPSLGLSPGVDTTGLLAELLGNQKQAPPVGQLAPSAHAAHAALPQGYAGIQSAGGPQPRQDSTTSLLQALSASGVTLPGVGQPAAPGDAQNGSGGLAGSSKRAGRPKAGLGHASSFVNGLIGRYKLPITARDEPGHAAGGDHDPSVPGATAYDVGGSDGERQKLWGELMRELGVRGAQFGGADVNVVRGGVRYQVISRPHGSGPHLHIGLRRTR